MPIREESFRTGCGRYIQGKGYLARIAEEVSRLGTAPLLIGDDTTLALTHATLEGALTAAAMKHRFCTHNGTCNDEDAKLFAAQAQEGGFDVIVGIGGGVLSDFAKLVAHFAALPVINVPTSTATCAAFAPLSVRYTREGRTVGSMHYEQEVGAVIADTALLAAQPVRLLLSGAFDAMAKFLEIKQRYTDSEDCPLGLDYAFVMAERSFTVLERLLPQCIADMQAGEVTPAVEQVIFTSLAATGVISGIARGSNQCALAHKFYETTRSLFPEAAAPYLHGEIVGVGLLLQNIFNGEAERNGMLLDLMHRHAMPAAPADVGVTCDEATFEEYYTRICNSSAIDKSNAEECAHFRACLRSFLGLQ